MTRKSTSDEERRNIMREMGRKGGLSGGRARAASLSPARRKSIARLGAKKTNAAIAGLTDEERARVIMEKRRATAHRRGLEAGAAGELKKSNPYAETNLTAQLRASWAAGWTEGKRSRGAR